MEEKVYDSIIIGAGPAGLGAALYTSRDRLKTLVIEKFFPGGQINNTDRIENYPGFESISGPALIEKMINQVTSFGAEMKMGTEVTSLKRRDDGIIEVTCDDEVFPGKSLVLSPGSSYRKLGVPGEDEFRNAGAGVSYCGTCDAPFFKDRKVVSVGGGNTAVEEALHLAKFASHVTIVHRRQEFRATRVLSEELMEKVNAPDSNISLQLDSVVTAIEGEGKVESVHVENVQTGEESDIACDGAFIFIGMEPNTEFLKGFVGLTDLGFIKCDHSYLRTAVPGVFAAGDCRDGSAMQLVTAVSDGVVAAIMLKQHLRDPEWWHKPAKEALTPGEW